MQNCTVYSGLLVYIDTNLWRCKLNLMAMLRKFGVDAGQTVDRKIHFKQA